MRNLDIVLWNAHQQVQLQVDLFSNTIVTLNLHHGKNMFNEIIKKLSKIVQKMVLLN